jgi:hypothetical protein
MLPPDQWEIRARAKYPIEPTRKLRKAKLSGRALVHELGLIRVRIESAARRNLLEHESDREVK